MNQQPDPESKWLAITSRRLFDYADKAYIELGRMHTDNDADRKRLNDARLYIAATRSAAEALYDFYGVEMPAGPMDDFVQPPEKSVGLWDSLKRKFG